MPLHTVVCEALTLTDGVTGAVIFTITPADTAGDGVAHASDDTISTVITSSSLNRLVESDTPVAPGITVAFCFHW